MKISRSTECQCYSKSDFCSLTKSSEVSKIQESICSFHQCSSVWREGQQWGREREREGERGREREREGERGGELEREGELGSVVLPKHFRPMESRADMLNEGGTICEAPSFPSVLHHCLAAVELLPRLTNVRGIPLRLRVDSTKRTCEDRHMKVKYVNGQSYHKTIK